MNALKDMLYYTNPIPNVTNTGGRLYVIDTAYDRNSHLAGTVMDITNRSVVLNGKPWKVSTDGSYVAGHIVNSANGTGHYNASLVGLTSSTAGYFSHGFFEHFGRFPGSDDPKYALVSRLRNSDGSHLMAGQNTHGHLTTWVPAAPWAAALLPHPGDTMATVTAKRELAEKKWKLYRAVAEMAHEGYQRGWTDQLKELHENPDLDFLPRPRLGVLYVGNVLLPTGSRNVPREELPAEVTAKITALENLSATGAQTAPPVVSVGVTIPLDLKLDPETINLPGTLNDMGLMIRRQMGDHTITLGSHRVQHFINGLSSLQTI